MLKTNYYTPPTALDLLIFEKLVPPEHYLRKVKALIDFERFRTELATCYNPAEGRPADDPVLLLKLEFLEFQYNLSDRAVIAQAQVNVAFRYFLDLSIESGLPDPSLFSVFRQRLGAAKHEAVLQGLLTQAREHSWVKDRLRLKDATHVIANIAIPSTIRLVAETRAALLQAARPFAPERVATETTQVATLRAVTADLADAERLLQRVQQLQRIVAWADTIATDEAGWKTAPESVQHTFRAALALAHKVLADRADPEAGDKVLSVQDPDARQGKHGAFFEGYVVDVAMDADSELITAVNVLPGNGNEVADAAVLLTQEEQAQGTDIAALSIDGIGFRGPALREWQDPQGLHLDVFVPPTAETTLAGYFPPRDFQVLVEAGQVRCPAGHCSLRRKRTRYDTGWEYQFARPTCAACPLLEQCMPRLPRASGRHVIRNDYEAEYAAARQKAQTAEYTAVRRQHRHIERKLGELVRHHQLRWARYRGQARVQLQACVTAVVVNIRRMVDLASARLQVTGAGV
jgi:transposase